MRRKTIFFFFLLNIFILGGCQSSKAAVSDNVTDFSTEAVSGLMKNAKEYSNQEYQAGDVPLNEYVRITGLITKTDGDDNRIVNGDRLMIENDGVEYQIFNQQDNPLKVGDSITVYGEYYGFIKGAIIEIEREES